jgi:hypothetical protein
MPGSRHVLATAIAACAWLTASDAWAMPTRGTAAPAAGSTVNDVFTATVTVTSPYVITGVRATVGGVVTALSNIAGTTKWAGPVDISAQPLGPTTLDIAADDANAETATRSVGLKHDHPPKLTVLTPDYTVGRPSVRLEATCDDIDFYPCASITAGAFASTATPALDQMVSFASFAGQAVDVTFTATDAAGMTATKLLHLYGPPAAPLLFVDELAGRVLDVNATTILFVNTDGVQTKNRSSGVITVLGPSAEPSKVAHGHLSSTGAIWTGGISVSGTYAARSTTLPDFRAHGDWAAWGGGDPYFNVQRQNSGFAIKRLVIGVNVREAREAPLIHASHRNSYADQERRRA